MNTRKLLFVLLPLLFPAFACSAQNRGSDRKPAVAGLFYPGTRTELDGMLRELFKGALPSTVPGEVVAIIVPHAGYVFSGGVAASGYTTIDRDKEYDNIFIIGPSHSIAFEGASVYTAGNFVTPLGTVEVNRELGAGLIRNNPVFSDRLDAQAGEHSVEVQVPFLQHILSKPFRIVPIVVGANSPATCMKIAGALRPYLNTRNLFVISSDFSHYPAYNDAVRVDKATAAAILTNSPDNLLAAMEHNAAEGVPNLATSLCGWSAVLTLLYMTAGGSGRKFTQVQYKNSGDSPEGERGRVVGYNAIAVSEEKTPRQGEFSLSQTERDTLLQIARKTVEQYVLHGGVPGVEPAGLSEPLRAHCGAFVTLYERGELRGCIGRFDADEPLWTVVQQMAVASASQDPRFNPVRPSEVKDLRIEISVLTPMRKISSIDEFHLGKQGIYMKKGNHAGTFLPQVALETNWTKEEFLGHCAEDKAGIGWDGWKDAELYVYEALVFGEAGQ
ncbi:MAG TPA: AmmeMemoRadiSam system protein B [Bacteroidota bacterium]|nr:AmmeMemoRadiSam system protein B [Bacteroidota bacterium]